MDDPHWLGLRIDGLYRRGLKRELCAALRMTNDLALVERLEAMDVVDLFDLNHIEVRICRCGEDSHICAPWAHVGPWHDERCHLFGPTPPAEELLAGERYDEPTTGEDAR